MNYNLFAVIYNDFKVSVSTKFKPIKNQLLIVVQYIKTFITSLKILFQTLQFNKIIDILFIT